MSYYVGTLIPSFSRPNAFKSSQLLFTTSSGTIGIISALDAASSAQMSNLQRNMSVMAPSIGGLDHSE